MYAAYFFLVARIAICHSGLSETIPRVRCSYATVGLCICVIHIANHSNCPLSKCPYSVIRYLCTLITWTCTNKIDGQKNWPMFTFSGRVELAWLVAWIFHLYPSHTWVELPFPIPISWNYASLRWRGKTSRAWGTSFPQKPRRINPGCSADGRVGGWVCQYLLEH